MGNIIHDVSSQIPGILIDTSAKHQTIINTYRTDTLCVVYV